MSFPVLISIFIASFLFAIAAVVSPGPVMTAIVSQSPRRGWLVGPLIATGHSLIELGIIVLLAFGLTSGLNTPAIQIIIAIAGGGLLIWMGIDMLAGVIRNKVRLPGVSDSADHMNNNQLIRLGMVTTLSNPFWYAWWVTAVPTYLTQLNAVAPLTLTTFFIGHISADYAWDTLLSTVVSSGRRWITDSVFRVIITACGLFFLYLGGTFLLKGLQMLP